MSLNVISITFILPSSPPNLPQTAMILNFTLLKWLRNTLQQMFYAHSIYFQPVNLKIYQLYLQFTKVNPFFLCFALKIP